MNMHITPIAHLAEPAPHPAVVEAQEWLEVVVMCLAGRSTVPPHVDGATLRAQAQIAHRGPVWMRREARRMRGLGRSELRERCRRSSRWDYSRDAGIRACFVTAAILTTCAAALERDERRARITAGVKRWEREEG